VFPLFATLQSLEQNPESPQGSTPHTHSHDSNNGYRHWRYISSFHGPWLQLPPEILSSLAHQNYTMPSPRLIDPSVFYDIVKIRKAVDEASQDSVRASNGVATNPNNNGGRMDMFGAPGGGAPLSKERIFKIRQKAVRLLGEAFKLDEVAASVATMQATSTVEDVGAHVFRREPNNLGALLLSRDEGVSGNVLLTSARLQMRSMCTSSSRRFLLAPWNSTRPWIRSTKSYPRYLWNNKLRLCGRELWCKSSNGSGKARSWT
jgi:hypothetical protein